MHTNANIQLSHERLEAYRVALEFLALAHELAAGLPKGAAPLADQLERAATSALLNTAEGAGRRTGKEKSRFYDIARGSAVECAAVVDAIAVRGLAAPARVSAARDLLYRLVRLLAGLARSARARMASEAP
jgi:four helix bundle protein